MKQTRARLTRRSVETKGAQPADGVVAPRVRRRKATPVGEKPTALAEPTTKLRTRTSSNRGPSPISSEPVEPISLEVAARAIAERDDRRALTLDDVATQLRTRPRRKRGPSLDEVTAQLEARSPVSACAHEALDFVLPARPIAMELISGRGHYERVIAAVTQAHTSVWIATANAKELMVENPRARRGRYVSILSLLDDLAARGVELRMLHAEIPSGPFREELAQHPRLVAGGLALRRCPRVHMKAVIVDGALLYLGSANWTGAGLGAKGSGRRNFELGFVTDDAELLDQVQAIYERVWIGGECDACKLRDSCPGPLIELRVRALESTARGTPRGRKMPARSAIRRRRRPRLI